MLGTLISEATWKARSREPDRAGTSGVDGYANEPPCRFRSGKECDVQPAAGHLRLLGRGGGTGDPAFR